MKVEDFGGDGKASGLTHIVTMVLGGVSSLLVTIVLYIASDMRTDIKHQGDQISGLANNIGTIKANADSDRARIVSLEIDDRNQDDRTRTLTNTLGNHESRISSNTARIDDLDRRISPAPVRR